MRYTFILLVLVAISASAAADDSPPAKQYAELLEQYEQEGGARRLGRRFLELAEKHATDPAAADALLWVVKKVRGKKDTTRALDLLAQHHVDNAKLGAAGKDIARSRSPAAEKLLRKLIEQAPRKEVQAAACHALGLLLDTEAGILDQLQDEPELAPRVLQYYGTEYGGYLGKLTREKLDRKRQAVYERMQKSFATTRWEDSTLGELAAKRLFYLRHLAVGREAPDIKGHDIGGKPFKLSDFRGKVVLLTFWGHW